jgi:transcription elongation factor GreA
MPGFFLFFNLLRKVMSEFVYVTEEGLQKMKEELDHLRNERPAIARMIADARDKGDLTENAEYSAAKEAQGMLEMKIARLEDMVARSRIIDGSRINTVTVQILNKVRIRNKANGTVMEYQLVPEGEANLKEGKIAATSPIAKGIMGKKVGDVVEVKVPAGVIPFEIVEISI